MTEAKKTPFKADEAEIIAARLIVSLNKKDGKETDEFTKWLAEGAPPEHAPARPLKRSWE